MQQLQVKPKNTPRNASLVPCSVSSALNKEEIPSVQNILLACNNSEENRQQHRVGSEFQSRKLHGSIILAGWFGDIVKQHKERRQFLPRLKIVGFLSTLS